MRWKLREKISNKDFEVELLRETPTDFIFLVNKKEVSLPKTDLHFDTESHRDRQMRVLAKDRIFLFEFEDQGGNAGAKSGIIKSQMPGKIVKVPVKEGDRVEAGTSLLVMEAMKMENEIRAEFTAKVEKVHVKAGESVESGTPLVELASV